MCIDRGSFKWTSEWFQQDGESHGTKQASNDHVQSIYDVDSVVLAPVQHAPATAELARQDGHKFLAEHEFDQ